MAFTLHDSLSDRTIPLPERVPNETSLYVCGPTVYGTIHVGNTRPPVVFDVLVRHLRASGRRVTYVRNYTDVDDKIIQVAIEQSEDPRAVSERFIAAYEEDMKALNCLVPDKSPRVSEHIGDIICHIEALIAKGSAYATPEGDVYFDVATFADYGKLSKRVMQDPEGDEGRYGRGKVGESKRNDHDFALWKSAKGHEPEGARWKSPWGEGRPGWHIECSAMAHCLLGDHFDLHGGGQDLKFPHHENEIAQSEAVYGPPLARGWMHNGFIEVDVERNASFSAETLERLSALRESDPDLMKIAKSDGRRLMELQQRDPDLLTAEDRALTAVLERKVHFGKYFQFRALRRAIDPEAIRLWILGTHYRSPLSFDLTEEDGGGVRFAALEQAEKRVEYFYDTRARIAAKAAVGFDSGPKSPGAKFFEEALGAFDKALDEDLNTAGALDPMNRIFERTNKLCDMKKADPGDLRAAFAAVRHVTRVTGVAEGEPDVFFERVTARRVKAREINPRDVDALVRERVSAREAKDFVRADQIRAELTRLGIELRDNPTGTTWRAL